MTFTPVPNLIEQNDFSGGWNPDQDVTSSDTNTLRSVLNLLPELGGTGALVTRKGFYRALEEVAGKLASHYCVAIHPFRGNSTSYLIMVFVKNEAAINNVQLWAVNTGTMTSARIDTADVQWDNPTSYHWGMSIDEVYYGGSRGNPMYSWNPSGPTWNDEAGVDTSWKTLDDGINDDYTAATELPRDFAWRGKEIVIYGGNHYMPAEDIRFDKWESSSEGRYKRGDKVSHKATWATTNSYWKSFECIKAHTSDTAAAEPGVGASWRDYWKKVRLPLPVNDDNETSSKWYFVPIAAETDVACWHGDRLWMRYDGQGDKSRVLYSAPIQPEKDEDVPETVWDPTDFAPGNDRKGPGGGWVPFNDGKKGGVVEALFSYGQYLLVFKRQAIWVLSGLSEESFTRRRLASNVGACGPEAVDELDGLVYFLSDDGLYVTDGTAVEPVPGFEKFANTIEARLDLMHAVTAKLEPMVYAYDDRIWVSLPYIAGADAETKYWTLVYEPKTGGIFKTNMPVCAMTTHRVGGVPKLWFAPCDGYGAYNDYLMQYDSTNGANHDDTAADTVVTADIAWQATTAWWPFGLRRQQRRIRRVWALVKGSLTATLTWYRDWDTSLTGSNARAISSTTVADHIEGSWFADSHAVSFKVSGTEAPATLYGIAVDTEPRRDRYHVT